MQAACRESVTVIGKEDVVPKWNAVLTTAVKDSSHERCSCHKEDVS